MEIERGGVTTVRRECKKIKRERERGDGRSSYVPVGFLLGSGVGTNVGSVVGTGVGFGDGRTEGWDDGQVVGRVDGTLLG
jgi:hypothetical protein